MIDETADIGRMFGATEAVDTFLGFPALRDVGTLDADIGILGVPCASPYTSVGPYCAGATAAPGSWTAAISATTRRIRRATASAYARP